VLIHDLSLSNAGHHWELSGSVKMESLDVEALRLWFRFPAAWSDGTLDASPFLSSLVATAMWWREPLAIEGPVSPQLLETSAQAMDVLRTLFPQLGEPVALTGETVTPPPAQPVTACLFSLGVDSWYSVLRALENPLRGAPPLTVGVYVPDVDWQYSAATHEHVRADLQRAAQRVGIELVTPESNLRSFTERFEHWGVTHGGVLAGTVSAMGPHTLLFPSSQAYGEAVPNGSHPTLDHLWSTERTTVVHHGGEARRIDKLRFLTRHDVALETLKVCYEGDTRKNCGRCIKCMLTMAGLAAVDALDRCDRFDVPLDVSRVRWTRLKGPIHRAMLQELVPLLEGDRAKRRIGRAIEFSLARDELRSGTKRLWRATGLAPAQKLGKAHR
jgi:hypothetical protein